MTGLDLPYTCNGSGVDYSLDRFLISAVLAELIRYLISVELAELIRYLISVQLVVVLISIDSAPGT
jgi:hypothetical protein